MDAYGDSRRWRRELLLPPPKALTKPRPPIFLWGSGVGALGWRQPASPGRRDDGGCDTSMNILIADDELIYRRSARAPLDGGGAPLTGDTKGLPALGDVPAAGAPAPPT